MKIITLWFEALHASAIRLLQRICSHAGYADEVIEEKDGTVSCRCAKCGKKLTSATSRLNLPMRLLKRSGGYVAVLLLTAAIASAGRIHVAWTPSPSTNVVTHIIYAAPFSLTESNRLAAPVRVIVPMPGTNSPIDLPVVGLWYLFATAADELNVESEPSNMIVHSNATNMFPPRTPQAVAVK